MRAKIKSETEYDLGNGRTLKVGDAFKASAGKRHGSYFRGRNGRVPMDSHGEYVLTEVIRQGRRVWLRGRTGKGVVELVYVGPTFSSAATGMVNRAHKITKRRTVK